MIEKNPSSFKHIRKCRLGSSDQKKKLQCIIKIAVTENQNKLHKSLELTQRSHQFT